MAPTPRFILKGEAFVFLTPPSLGGAAGRGVGTRWGGRAGSSMPRQQAGASLRRFHRRGVAVGAERATMEGSRLKKYQEPYQGP